MKKKLIIGVVIILFIIAVPLSSITAYRFAKLLLFDNAAKQGRYMPVATENNLFMMDTHTGDLYIDNGSSNKHFDTWELWVVMSDSLKKEHNLK